MNDYEQAKVLKSLLMVKKDSNYSEMKRLQTQKPNRIGSIGVSDSVTVIHLSSGSFFGFADMCHVQPGLWHQQHAVVLEKKLLFYEVHSFVLLRHRSLIS